MIKGKLFYSKPEKVTKKKKRKKRKKENMRRSGENDETYA
jgi:hypothetical protein